MAHKHRFERSIEHKGYDYCVDCGTFHSINPLPPNEIYEEKEYWGDGSGRSTLEQQVSNMTCTDECGISKVDRVLQFVPKEAKTVLEVACAPGILMKRLNELGKSCIGIEPCDRYIPFIASQARLSAVVHGYYPQVFTKEAKEQFDCIIGLDVMEHIEDFDGFIEATHRLLKPEGTAIFMSPIIYADGFIHGRDFISDEHVWLFSRTFLDEYLKEIFSKVEFFRWVVGHELVILKK